ncbi:MAG TPA: branched-chain amino acid ABC transporter permease [Syntrophorhabdales bacterium]|nr:branched-chain amino acid ABC transporter permease [Syntrophorhabdales bacterium]
MGDFSYLVQFFFSGLTSGAVYALMAVSLVIVYKVSLLICFAQGEFFVIGALTMVTLTSKGLPMPAALGVSIVVSTVIGALVERILIRPIQNTSVGNLIVMTIAISLALRGSALLIWGKESAVLPPFSAAPPIQVLGATLQSQVLWIIGITMFVLIVIWFFFEKTRAGIAMRACSENRLGASLMGISTQKAAILAWAWGSGIGALAGMAVAPLFFMQYGSGLMPMVKGFIAMSIGGLASIAGAVIAGFLLGIVEAYTIGLLSSQFSDTIVFTILLILLFFRPSGLFSASGRREV